MRIAIIGSGITGLETAHICPAEIMRSRSWNLTPEWVVMYRRSGSRAGTVHYSLPLGPIGNLVHALIIRQQLELIFDYRTRATEEISGASDT